MIDDFGHPVKAPETVPATLAFLHHIGDRFDVLSDFHPSFEGSLTLVDRESDSGITLVIVESSAGETPTSIDQEGPTS